MNILKPEQYLEALSKIPSRPEVDLYMDQFYSSTGTYEGFNNSPFHEGYKKAFDQWYTEYYDRIDSLKQLVKLSEAHELALTILNG